MTEKNPLIQVLDRALDIMELLARAEKPMRSVDIAREMGVGLQTLNNQLRTLYLRGYLSQDASRCYRLGPQCFYLGSFADRWSGLRSAVVEPLGRLVRETGLAGFAGVVENDKMLAVALLNPGETAPRQPPQLWAEELHSTACGRVLLAAMTETGRHKLLARTTRRNLTGRTVVDPAALDALCREVLLAGYAEVRGESRPGVSSVAVPVRDASGRTYAALALSGGDGQWEESTLSEKVMALSRAAEALPK